MCADIQRRRTCTRRHRGGAAIGAGTYGCVFLPQLESDDCDNSKKTTNISKLMETRDAQEEYDEVRKLKTILKRIPNYKSYFLVSNISMCKMKKITPDDLKGYTSTCKQMIRQGYTPQHIKTDKAKRDLRMLTMPYGGINIEKYFFSKHLQTQKDYTRLHFSLVHLLEYAVFPMNRLGVYHCDVKARNILVDPNSMKTNIIDWGYALVLSKHNRKSYNRRSRKSRKSHNHNSKSTKTGKHSKESKESKDEPGDTLPSRVRDYPYNFNMPVTVVLFQKSVHKQIMQNIQKPPGDIARDVYAYTSIHLVGHLSILREDYETMHHFYENKTELEMMNLPPVFTDYVVAKYTDIFARFLHHGDFHVTDYFFQHYINNADLYGLASIYSQMVLTYIETPTEEEYEQRVTTLQEVIDRTHDHVQRNHYEEKLQKYKEQFGEKRKNSDLKGFMQQVAHFVLWMFANVHFHIPRVTYLSKLEDIVNKVPQENTFFGW